VPLPFPIDIAEHCDSWPVDRALIERAIEASLSVLDKPRLGELSVVLSNDEKIRALNRDYRGKDKATNVLSFPVQAPASLLGDIVLALETVRNEAAQKQRAFEDHLLHLLIHGFLHLQGYDHQEDTQADIMEALEIKALALLNIDNPYIY
jgi:probable rRNA maturation factor